VPSADSTLSWLDHRFIPNAAELQSPLYENAAAAFKEQDSDRASLQFRRLSTTARRVPESHLSPGAALRLGIDASNIAVEAVPRTGRQCGQWQTHHIYAPPNDVTVTFTSTWLRCYHCPTDTSAEVPTDRRRPNHALARSKICRLMYVTLQLLTTNRIALLFVRG